MSLSVEFHSSLEGKRKKNGLEKKVIEKRESATLKIIAGKELVLVEDNLIEEELVVVEDKLIEEELFVDILVEEEPSNWELVQCDESS